MLIGGRVQGSVGGTAGRSGETYFFFAPLFIPFFILGVPILDMAFAFIRRTAKRTGFATADKNHLHHRLLRLGHGHRRSVLILWAWTALLSGFILFPLYISSVNAFIPFGALALGVLLYTLLHPSLRGQATPDEPGAARRSATERLRTRRPGDPGPAGRRGKTGPATGRRPHRATRGRPPLRWWRRGVGSRPIRPGPPLRTPGKRSVSAVLPGPRQRCDDARRAAHVLGASGWPPPDPLRRGRPCHSPGSTRDPLIAQTARRGTAPPWTIRRTRRPSRPGPTRPPPTRAVGRTGRCWPRPPPSWGWA